MEFISDFMLPVTDPVLVFTIVMLIILVVPLVLRKLKTPGIVGFIVAGMVVGPFGLNILEHDEAVVLFSTVGLIYIMFLVGLDLDMDEFKKNRYKSIFFGLFTFAIPFIMGLLISYYGFNLGFIASMLVAIMISTHTLIAYPIVTRMGISRTETVMVTVGGTIIADTIVLLILAVTIKTHEGELNTAFWIQLVVSLFLYGIIIFWGFPKIARWFLKNMDSEKTLQYVFVMTLLFIAAYLSKVAGIEPILGAFVAGIALSRFIPHTSALMNRIEFVGNALFIPFFLISVGMLVDLRILFLGNLTIIFIIVMTIIALAGKWLAALVTQLAFRLSPDHRRLIYGLSSSRAAATLAVITIGYNLGLVSINILNGTIMIVFITCLVSSFVTQKAARNIARIESDQSDLLPDESDKILVSIYNTDTIENLMDLALFLKSKSSTESIYTLTIVHDNEEAKQRVVAGKKMLEKAILHASAVDQHVEVITRIDENVSIGISRTARELMVSCIIMGWTEKPKGSILLFGTILSNIVNKCNQMLWVSRIQQPLNTLKNIMVLIPRAAEYELGFKNMLGKIMFLSTQIGEGITFYSSSETSSVLTKVSTEINPGFELKTANFDDWNHFSGIREKLDPDDLLLVVSARQGRLSWRPVFKSITDKLVHIFNDRSFILIYPEQSSTTPGVLEIESADGAEYE